MKKPLNQNQSQNKVKEDKGNQRGSKWPPIPVINDLMANYKKEKKDASTKS